MEGDFESAPSPFSGVVVVMVVAAVAAATAAAAAIIEPLLVVVFVKIGLLFVGAVVLGLGFKLAKKLNGDEAAAAAVVAAAGVALNPAKEPNALFGVPCDAW